MDKKHPKDIRFTLFTVEIYLSNCPLSISQSFRAVLNVQSKVQQTVFLEGLDIAIYALRNGLKAL